jgi:hypothetical protein
MTFIQESLAAQAQQIAENYAGRETNLNREILDLETQLQQKQAALHITRMAIKRAANFVPMLGANFHCPACWIEKEELATLRPIPGDVMRCNSCAGDFGV